MSEWLSNIDAHAAPPGADRLEAQLAASPALAGLHALRRDLEPLSAQLSDDLAQLFAAAHARGAHTRAAVSRRSAHAWRRRSGAVVAMAVSLIAVVAVWTLRHDRIPAHPATAAMPDRIFTGFDEKNIAERKAPAGDEIFRGNFLPDEIFNSSRSHHDG
jgi:hypothetical protein